MAEDKKSYRERLKEEREAFAKLPIDEQERILHASSGHRGPIKLIKNVAKELKNAVFPKSEGKEKTKTPKNDKEYKKGGSVTRGDGCAKRGKTKGRTY